MSKHDENATKRNKTQQNATKRNATQQNATQRKKMPKKKSVRAVYRIRKTETTTPKKEPKPHRMTHKK